MLNTKMINKYRELLVEVATDFKHEYYKPLFESILTIHNKESYLSHDVHQLRTRLKDEFLNSLNVRIPEDDFLIISSFI